MPRKPKSQTIEEAGVRVRIFQRGRQWWADIRLKDERYREPLKTTAKSTAEDGARALARELAKQRLLGVTSDTLTLGQLFEAYRQHRVPSLAVARRREAATRIAMFLEAWSDELPVCDIDQTRIDAYCTARRSLQVVAPGLRPTENGQLPRGYRKPQPVRDGALDGELRFLNAVLNWACGFRTGGKALLAANPLPRRAQERRAMGWPVEKNPRQPVAAHDRYTRTQEHTDAVDMQGRLRCIVALARFTGRRESAICALRASDLLLSPDRIRAALADAGGNAQDAEHMPFGAIRWRGEADKQGYLFISPISRDTRSALDTYLRRSPRMGDVPLFPAPGRKRKKDAPPPAEPAPERPLLRETAAKWLIRAERLSGLPKLRGGVFHPYRRLWAIERQHLPAIEVAEAGGWGDTQALTRIYQRATAAGVLRAVTGG
jgi:integrase